LTHDTETGPHESSKSFFAGRDQTRNMPGRDGIWIGAALSMAILYWTLCPNLLDADVTSQFFSPWPATNMWQVLIIENIPFAAAIGLAFAFRVIDKALYSWALAIIGAKNYQRFRLFRCLFRRWLFPMNQKGTLAASIAAMDVTGILPILARAACNG
jgi:hypothetical protein